VRKYNENQYMKSIFDEQWIKENTSYEKSICFSFKRKDVNYEDECIKETVYYDKEKNEYVAIDDWGGDAYFSSWQEFVGFLNLWEAEILMEITLKNVQI